MERQSASMAAMNDKQIPPNHADSALTDAEWGYLHPNCRGEAALAFFTRDLARTIEMHLGGRAVTHEDVAQAQMAIDALLAKYVEIEAAPYAFEDAAIRLRIAVDRAPDGSEMPYVALETSERLESMILDMQERARLGLN